MTALAIYGGPKKRDIINRAYGLLGQSFTEFEISVEEYNAGLMCLNDTMAQLEDEFGVVLGYNYPTNGTDGSPEDESGLARGVVRAASYMLAKYLAPSIGKTMPPEALSELARAQGTIMALAPIPMMEMGRQTPRGQGNRYMNGPRPYFVPDISPDEVTQ